MAQKNIGTNWTRESRNAMNDNFDELYANYIGAGSSAAEAERLAREAVITANKAKEGSGLAISEAQATQKQLDDIILDDGTGNAEVIQARGGEPLLNDRLNKVDQQITSISHQLEEKASQGDLDVVNQQMADTVLLISPIGAILNVLNDGTQDISAPLLDYAANKEEVYLYFPPGKYRWDGNTKLTNRKIKFAGDNAVIEHYGSGPNLDIGSELTHNTVDFHMSGIDFINKRPKPATGGSGATALQISDCVNLTLRDINIYDAEQYGINLRRSGGTIKNAVLDNVNVYRTSGTLGTTTSIALETRANSGDGKIENLIISNSYFEVTDSYTNSDGGITQVALSNASKLQAVDNLEMVNVVFKGGKENGPLTFSHDVKSVKMTNVTCKSDSLASKGLTISLCPDLELQAVNCDLGTDNFSQSIGVAGAVKEAKFVACRLQRVTTVSGTPKNFKFENCTFYLPTTALNISLTDSFFTNCTIDVNSPIKDVYLVGNGNKLVNFSGINIIDITGSNNTILGGDCESIRPNGSSSGCHIKGLVATSSGRSFRNITDNTSNYLVEECTFVRTVGGGDTSIVNPRGKNMQFVNNKIIQKDKAIPIPYAIFFTNSTDSSFIEKRNYVDVNVGTSVLGQTSSTNIKRYDPGDVFIVGGVPKTWNGTEFM